MKKITSFITNIMRQIFIILVVWIKTKLLDRDNYYNYYTTPLKPWLSPIFNSFSGFNHEDLLVDYLLKFKKRGFYVDIGANDPNFPGNTKRFYLKGWRGVNLEPQEIQYKNLCRIRPRDINLKLAVAAKKGELTFYKLPTLPNGSSLNYAMIKLQSLWYGGVKIVKTKVKAITLSEVFQKYVGKRSVDFISIDTEGTELDILKSNNWQKFRAKLLIVEIVHFDRQEIINYLKNNKYDLIYTNNINGIFIDKNYQKQLKNLNN